MTRKEMNYQLMYLVLIYIMDSATNIIGPVMNAVAFMMYVSVFLHVLIYSMNTLKSLKTQAEVIYEARVTHLLPIISSKKSMFLKFFWCFLVYFAGEFLIHFAISDYIINWDTTWQKRVAV